MLTGMEPSQRLRYVWPGCRPRSGRGLLALKGHRSVGGLRASMYNALPEPAVDDLVAFLADFESRHG